MDIHQLLWPCRGRRHPPCQSYSLCADAHSVGTSRSISSRGRDDHERSVRPRVAHVEWRTNWVRSIRRRFRARTTPRMLLANTWLSSTGCGICATSSTYRRRPTVHSSLWHLEQLPSTPSPLNRSCRTMHASERGRSATPPLTWSFPTMHASERGQVQLDDVIWRGCGKCTARHRSPYCMCSDGRWSLRCYFDAPMGFG